MSAVLSTARRLPRVWSQHWLATLAGGCVLAGAAALQACSETNTDVSWAFTLDERWLGGERPYLDLIEVNPPATLLVYMPVVLIARLLGLRPEGVLIPMVLSAIVVSAGVTSFLLARSNVIRDKDRALWFCVMAAVLALLPSGDFAEREHLATIAMLPILGVLAGRLSGLVPSHAAWLAAGSAAGVAIAIKPVFGLALVGPVGLLGLRQGWRALVACPELVVAAVLPAIYGAAVPILFPAFTFDILHQVLTAYVPLRQPLAVLLMSPVVFAAAGFAAITVVMRPRSREACWSDILLLAAFGFGAGYVLQGKAWPYQALPAVSLAALAAINGLLEAVANRTSLIRQTPAWAAYGVFAACAALAFSAHPTMGAIIPGLKDAIEASKPRPTMMAITSDIAIGHPLVRDLGGSWVGSYPAEWISGNAEKLRAMGLSRTDDAELGRLSLVEQTRVADDLARKGPAVLLVQGERWQHYLDNNDALRKQMEHYEPKGTFGSVSLWVRRTDEKPDLVERIIP